METNRSTPHSENISQYLIQTISIPLVDHVVSGLVSRFDNSITSYHGHVLVASKLLHFKYSNTEFPWTQKCIEDDMSNPYSINAELELWGKYWVNYKS